jgi:hypothetical protein
VELLLHHRLVLRRPSEALEALLEPVPALLLVYLVIRFLQLCHRKYQLLIS